MSLLADAQIKLTSPCIYLKPSCHLRKPDEPLSQLVPEPPGRISMAKRRHSRRRRTSTKHYLLIVLACAVVALVMQYLVGVPDQVQDYAEDKMDEAVRKAVKAEVQEATKTTTRR